MEGAKRTGRGPFEWTSCRDVAWQVDGCVGAGGAETVRLVGQGGGRVVFRIQKTEPEARSEVTGKPGGGLFA